MSAQITVTLPDDVYQRVERLALLTHRAVADVLTDTIAIAVPSLTPSAEQVDSFARLSDQEVLALTDLKLEPDQDQRLSDLLQQQQTSTLTEQERIELARLMDRYQTGLLHKAYALREAVRRGLREPLLP